MSAVEWRNSTLSRLQRCAESFRRAEIEKEVEPTSPQAVRGSAVHSVARIALRRKIGKGNEALPTVEEARDLAADLFELRWRESDLRIMVPDEDLGVTLAEARGQSKDAAIDLAGFHVERVAPAIQPVYVEHKITVKPKNSDLVIHGTLDLVAREKHWDLDPAERETTVIRDLKTGKSAPKQDAADTSQQLTMYGLILLAKDRKPPAGMALDHIYRTPTAHELKHIEQRTTRDADDYRALVERINVATEAVKKGVFLPADPSAWYCSPKWCGFYATCPFVRRTKRPTS